MVPVTARQLRESPRMVLATVLSAGLLVLIGILVANAAAGTSDTPSAPAHQRVATRAHATAPTAAAPAAQAAALRSAETTIAHLHASLRTQVGRLSSANASLHAAQAAARCWHAKVIHPIKTRGLHCAAPTP